DAVQAIPMSGRRPARADPAPVAGIGPAACSAARWLSATSSSPLSQTALRSAPGATLVIEAVRSPFSPDSSVSPDGRRSGFVSRPLLREGLLFHVRRPTAACGARLLGDDGSRLASVALDYGDAEASRARLGLRQAGRQAVEPLERDGGAVHLLDTV